jgi:tyrosyl-tRNA synthetase
MGVDKRDLSMMARECCEHIEGAKKPIFLLHHMLPGLKEGQNKISKSDPSSAIFMEDIEAGVKSKIKKGFLPYQDYRRESMLGLHTTHCFALARKV